MKVLWLVCARSGSKSIPDKNIKLLGNQPLLSYRIRSALDTKTIGDVWISTDSAHYADIARKYGAEIPFIRPYHLATDDASSVDVVLHAMEHAVQIGRNYDCVGLLEPTSPFVSSEDLDKAVDLLFSCDESSSIVCTRESRPNRIFIQSDQKYLNELAANLKQLSSLGRQSFPKEITPSGGFYISKWNQFIQNKTFYCESTLNYLVDDISGLEIDEPMDWEFAEFIINKFKLQ